MFCDGNCEADHRPAAWCKAYTCCDSVSGGAPSALVSGPLQRRRTCCCCHASMPTVTSVPSDRSPNLNVNILALNRVLGKLFVTQRQSSLKWKVSKMLGPLIKHRGGVCQPCLFKMQLWRPATNESNDWSVQIIFFLPLSVEGEKKTDGEGAWAGLNMIPLGALHWWILPQSTPSVTHRHGVQTSSRQR